jgi:hypothetical protein
MQGQGIRIVSTPARGGRDQSLYSSQVKRIGVMFNEWLASIKLKNGLYEGGTEVL